MFFKDEIIGVSPVLLDILAQADKMAGSNARVLITGETGTGKELLARRLHAKSACRHGPFIAINCAALPAPLLESELFGHVKGAFSGAHRTHEGLVAAAAGGTLFLDEIADMPLPLQAKLLRFLENGTFRKVGATEEEQADVRVFSATHGDLKNEAVSGAFREDLYYRLSLLTLEMPPLRARKEDVVLLAEHFMRRFSAAEGKDFLDIAADAAARLARYPWPGNIRELQNLLHKIVVLHEGPTLTDDMAKGVLPQNLSPVAENVIALDAAFEADIRPLWRVQRDAIETAIRLCRGNIPRAAALLEVSPSTLYRRRSHGNADNTDISIS